MGRIGENKMILKKDEKEKTLRELIRERDETINILKAIINKFGSQEISVSQQEISNASKYQIYVKNEYLRNAKIYQLVDNEKFLESYKEG